MYHFEKLIIQINFDEISTNIEFKPFQKLSCHKPRHCYNELPFSKYRMSLFISCKHKLLNRAFRIKI